MPAQLPSFNEWCSDTELDGLAWRPSSLYELGASHMCRAQLPVVWAPAAFFLCQKQRYEAAATS